MGTASLNDRERFQAIMHYRPFDRCIIQDFSCWDETITAWHHHGPPKDVDRSNSEEFFGLDPMWNSLDANVMLCPPFQTKILEDDGTYQP